MTTPTEGMPPPIDDELLSAWLDGQLSRAERDAVEAAIAADPAARAQATDLRATVALLRGLPQPAPRRTFILTPEQGAAIRPARVTWITRLFPAVSAASAVAAVLCIALVAGDLATGGFSTKRQGTTAPSAITSGTATFARVTVAAAAAATTAPVVAGTAASGVSGAGAIATRAPAANAPAGASAASSAQRPAAPAVGAAVIAPTAAGGAVTLPPLTPTIGSFAASTIALPATPTFVVNVQPPPLAARAPPSGGATVTTETHRVPVARVRAGEILLAFLAIAGIALAILGWRGRTRRT